MKFGFQMDPVHTLNHTTDSTLPMMLESQRRKNRNYIFSPSSPVSYTHLTLPTTPYV